MEQILRNYKNYKWQHFDPNQPLKNGHKDCVSKSHNILLLYQKDNPMPPMLFVWVAIMAKKCTKHQSNKLSQFQKMEQEL